MSQEAENALFLTGIVCSTICLFVQIFLYVVVPSTRKLDQKILTQMTVARLFNVIVEYTIFHVMIDNMMLKAAVVAFYLQSDAALICWMFIFTKNLYDKVTIVFVTKKNFLLLSILVWLFSFVLGILNPILIEAGYDQEFFYAYSIVKCIVLLVNIIFLFRILWIAIRRKTERNATGVIRICIVGFILLCITSLQVFLTDLTSVVTDMRQLVVVFSIINSFEPVAMTILFLILASKACQVPLLKVIRDKFRSY